jgi:hypothetical protein
MSAQIELDYESPAARQTRLDRAFAAFHAAHPEVYATLARLARVALARGRSRIGIKRLWEVMRWDLDVGEDDGEFKLNNNYPSRYARLLMRQERDLAGLFETRELRS